MSRTRMSGIALALLATRLAAPAADARIAGALAPPESQWALWYRDEAHEWNQALPIGNGRLGAMIYGTVTREHLQINEDTVWTGQPHDYAHPGAATVLPELRRLLFEGKQREAEQLAMKQFMSEPLRQMKYQPCGDLWIDWPAHTNVTDYRRAIDLETAVHTVSYRTGDTVFRRETFSSFPDQAIVSKLSADKPGRIDCDLSLTSPHGGSTVEAAGDDRLVLKGQVQADGVAFEMQLYVRVDGGTIEAVGNHLAVRGADAATLLVVAGTNVKNWRELTADPSRVAMSYLWQAGEHEYAELLQRHLADYQPLYRRVTLDLGRTEAADQPTDARIAAFAGGHDPQLAALTFQYGRYLLLGCSRPGTQPANLQGLWNPHLSPPWDSKYTCNINTEMNYWPAEPTALADCHEALFTTLGELMESGRRTAKVHYDARGWVLHHNFDMWRGTAPINNSNHGIWVTGGAWLSTHLWEHYLFTRDETFLRETAYPIMREAALFFVDYLVPDPKTGRLISGPSNSPEQGGLVMGPTMDHQIIRSLFRACVEAAHTLKTDDAFADQLAGMIPKIAPNTIGQHGQLQEWLEDKDNPKNQHRHVSHLWGVYPGCDITWQDTPDLWRAARQSLVFRGDAATGWSMGWKVNLWARFLDGNHAYLILSNLLAPVGKRGRGGMYPNLFDAHPPFQIDGNFGACAGIAEMLLQSHVRTDNAAGPGANVVHLLPALPDAWPAGRVHGLRARGGRTVDIEWRDGKLARATLTATRDETCPVRYGEKAISLPLKAGKATVIEAARFE